MKEIANAYHLLYAAYMIYFLLSPLNVHFCFLFNSEYVTQHRKPKRDFNDLVQQYAPYQPTHVGHVLFNGKLLTASANYGCFMTLSTNNPHAADIPHNLKVRPQQCHLHTYMALFSVILKWALYLSS